MQIKAGNDFFEAKNGKVLPVILDTKKLLNPHMLILGVSGAGKSHTIRNFVHQGRHATPRVQFHILDVHNDLDIEGASVVTFSAQAKFGLNPLIVNPDVEFGGVEKCIRTFLRVLNQASSMKLGVQQEDCVRELLLDVYHEFGFESNDPSTWAINEYETRLISGGKDNRLYMEVPIAEKDAAKELGARWDGEKKHWYVQTENYKGDLLKWKPAFKARRYPTVTDVYNFAREMHEQRFLGSDQRCVRALGVTNKVAQNHHRQTIAILKEKRVGYSDDATENALDKSKLRAIEAYTEYVNSIKTGSELDNLMKYQSPEVLRSTMIRLKGLIASGIFKDELPDFDKNNNVWQYRLKAIEPDERRMYVLFKLQELFSNASQRGVQQDIVDIVVLDELGSFTSAADGEKGEGIIGVIAREARKFGLGMWAATQTPATVPESLITAVATKIVLGIDEKYTESVIKNFGIDRKLLSFIQPWHTIAVQLKEKGAAKSRWWWVNLEKQ